jgi:protocatechuate 3,4-dioxygenase beta subunit
MQCCYFQGEVTADDQGRFKLITVRPGLYAGEASPPPAHIHVEGIGPANGLGTEIVFADDPHLPSNLINMVVSEVTKSDGVTWTGIVVMIVGK